MVNIFGVQINLLLIITIIFCCWVLYFCWPLIKVLAYFVLGVILAGCALLYVGYRRLREFLSTGAEAFMQGVRDEQNKPRRVDEPTKMSQQRSQFSRSNFTGKPDVTDVKIKEKK